MWQKIISIVAKITFIIALAIMTLTIILIYNTLKLSLLNDKNRIKTMLLVGANPTFIRRPYLKHGLKIGVISGLLSLLAIVGLLLFFSVQFPELNSFISIKSLISVFSLLIIIGIAIPIISIHFITLNYIKD